MADVYSLVKQDHEELRLLLGQLVDLEKCGGDASGHIASAADCMAAELQAHMEAEEEVLYSALENNDIVETDGEARLLITRAKTDHREARSLSLTLLLATGGTDEFRSAVHRLREAVLSHLEQEEDGVLTTARRVISDEQAGAMAAEFERQKQLIRGRQQAVRPY